MKIFFTKKEYRLLVDLLEISEWVLNSHECAEHEETKKYSDLIQKVYAFSKEAGCEDILHYDKESSEYYATLDYEENGIHMEYIDKFEEDVFWDGLASKLTTRDLVEQEGEDNIKKMEVKERISKIYDLESWYREEFFSNGLENVRVVKEKTGKSN